VAWVWEGGEGERESQADSPLRVELDTVQSHDPEIMTWAKNRSQTLNRWSHPDAPNLPHFIFKLGYAILHIVRPFHQHTFIFPLQAFVLLLIHFTFTYTMNATVHCYFCFKPALSFEEIKNIRQVNIYLPTKLWSAVSSLPCVDTVFHLVPFWSITSNIYSAVFLMISLTFCMSPKGFILLSFLESYFSCV